MVGLARHQQLNGQLRLLPRLREEEAVRARPVGRRDAHWTLMDGCGLQRERERE